MLFISIPIWLILQVTNRVKFHQAVYIITTLVLLKLAYAEVKLASEECLKEHNKISSKIEFMSNCEKDDPKKKDKDSKDPEEHLCFIMRWYCARECTMSAYGGKCVVESLFTLNLEEDDTQKPWIVFVNINVSKFLFCKMFAFHLFSLSKRGCLSTYQIEWSTVEFEFQTNCSRKEPGLPTVPKIEPPTTTSQLPITNSFIVLTGGQTEPATSTIEICYPNSPERNEVVAVHMLQPRKSHVSFLLGKVIISAGGYANKVALAHCEAFDPTTKKIWQSGSLNIRRSEPNVAFLDGIPYICGGYDDIRYKIVACEYFVSDEWKLVPGQLSTEHYSPAMASLGGFLYVIGGFKSDNNGFTISINTVERYDKNSKVWTQVVPMKFKRGSASVATFNGLVHVCGGFEYTQKTVFQVCESFDGTKWVTTGYMNYPRRGFNLVIYEEQVYALGGEIKAVEIYDTVNQKWTTLNVNSIYDRYKSYAVAFP